MDFSTIRFLHLPQRKSILHFATFLLGVAQPEILPLIRFHVARFLSSNIQEDGPLTHYDHKSRRKIAVGNANVCPMVLGAPFLAWRENPPFRLRFSRDKAVADDKWHPSW